MPKSTYFGCENTVGGWNGWREFGVCDLNNKSKEVKKERKIIFSVIVKYFLF